MGWCERDRGRDAASEGGVELVRPGRGRYKGCSDGGGKELINCCSVLIQERRGRAAPPV